MITHSWELTPKEAINLQKELAAKVVTTNFSLTSGFVGGVDVSYKDGKALAVTVLYTFPDLTFIEYRFVKDKIRFPYIPGLLSFRESPIALRAIEKLSHTPDLLLVDGQGYAHPRRFGLACHIGVLSDIPTIGCAKTRLTGEEEEIDKEKGSYSWLRDKGEIVGAVVRTRSNVAPVYVSVGNRIYLNSAIEYVLRCTTRYRLPEPLRQADRLTKQKVD